MKKQGTIVCAFPATGKTTAINKSSELGITACDSDSEDHHWVDRSLPREERVERPSWVQEYVRHLQEAASEHDFVFASTHDVVRDALVAAGVRFVVVYPTKKQRDEFIRRVSERSTGLHGEFGVNLLSKMWDTWLDGMERQTGCGRVVLQNGQYLSDALDQTRAQA